MNHNFSHRKGTTFFINTQMEKLEIVPNGLCGSTSYSPFGISYIPRGKPFLRGKKQVPLQCNSNNKGV